MLRSMAQVGRAPGTKGGGNQRKRTRLIIDVPAEWSAEALADVLAHGEGISPSTVLEIKSRSSSRAR